jgi:hypothetical protein
LVTKIAFKDFAESDGGMNAARELVGFFSISSQAEEILLSKQMPGSAVKCIQDVTTRWWATYSMCARLLRLKPYFYLMEAEGVLPRNLTDQQWIIVKDTTALLEPFMCAQRLLEGECYITISMIAFILWKIRSGLHCTIESPQSTEHVVRLATKMNTKFEEFWGPGDPGPVATEYLSFGPRRRPKGIPRLALIATLLDPRFKFGPGFSEEDKNIIWNLLKEMLRLVAMSEVQVRVEPEARDHRQQRRNGPVNDMFEVLNQLAMEEQAEIANEQDLHDNNNGNSYYHHRNEEIVKRVDAELLLYKREQHLPLRKEDGFFNNPLEWWRLKQQQYPLLAKVALRLLAIPSTMAPSEKYFPL